MATCNCTLSFYWFTGLFVFFVIGIYFSFGFTTLNSKGALCVKTRAGICNLSVTKVINHKIRP